MGSRKAREIGEKDPFPRPNCLDQSTPKYPGDRMSAVEVVSSPDTDTMLLPTSVGRCVL